VSHDERARELGVVADPRLRVFGSVCQILWNTADDPQVAKDPAAYLKEHGLGHTRGRPYHPMTQGRNLTLDIETKKERESTQCRVAANGSWNPREAERSKGPRRSDDIHRVLEVGTEYANFFERSRDVS